MANDFDYITVVGVGKRRNGVSKSGNAYDFIPVHITYPGNARNGVSGICTAVCNVDTADVERVRPCPGEDFTVTLVPSVNYSVTIGHWISRGHVDLGLL